MQSALNTTHNKGINTTPTLIGCEIRSPTEAPLLSQIQDTVQQVDLDELRIEIETHITQEQQAQKERYDKTQREATKYHKGDLALVQITSNPATGSNRKLHPKYK